MLSLTLQPAPACDIAGGVVCKNGASGWEASGLDLAGQGHWAGQFDQGNVIPGSGKKGRVERVLTIPVCLCQFPGKIPG